VCDEQGVQVGAIGVIEEEPVLDVVDSFVLMVTAGCRSAKLDTDPTSKGPCASS
jgi:hypothetical protein